MDIYIYGLTTNINTLKDQAPQAPRYSCSGTLVALQRLEDGGSTGGSIKKWRNYLWIIYGLSMDYLWIIYGL